MGYTTSDFSYHLPPELVAQTPMEPRDHSRLLVLERSSESFQHRRFFELDTLLGPKDLLVFNDSRVIPARLRGRKAGSGGQVEVLLLHREANGAWQALVKPGRRLPPGAVVEFAPQPVPLSKGDRGGGLYRAVIGERGEGGTRLVSFDDERAIEACGLVPLPPYIQEPLLDAERYQTIYARVQGSAAAPTAGLHFTKDLIARLSSTTAGLAFVTLHVGLDTFRPVDEEDPREHHMHREFAVLPDDTAQRINACKAAGGRIVTVGTTTARVLESAALESSSLRGDRLRATRPPSSLSAERGGLERRQAVSPYSGWTNLFIFPGYRFQVVDALITNFHLPRSSLLMLVSALAGKRLMDRAYAEAIQQRYRFYSFGDAMLIL